jgi:NDP-hexose-3-ketoreductase
MDVLIVGFSSLARRRLLPALVGLDKVDKIHIASRREMPSGVVTGRHGGSVIRGYEKALAETKSGLVYVSLPNALHYEWSMRALSAGFHVVVDKPAFLNAREAADAAALAVGKGLCCAEATVWQFHPMVELLRASKQSEGRQPVAAYACFSSPALDRQNFRLIPEMGGGVIYDRASYAVTCGRVVFGQEPEGVSCTVVERDSQTGVDLSCRITLKYPAHRALEGFYSLKADYRNSLSVVGETYSLDYDRIFTPPPDYEGPAVLRRKGECESITTPKGNSFALFLNEVFHAIEERKCEAFAQALVRDAKIVDSIRDAAVGA